MQSIHLKSGGLVSKNCKTQEKKIKYSTSKKLHNLSFTNVSTTSPFMLLYNFLIENVQVYAQF